MSAARDWSSVGIVEAQKLEFDEPLPLACGRNLDRYELMVETYGELNAARSNAVLICHALSGHHHAAGLHDPEDSKPGWWDAYIGPGKSIDTTRFFVVSINNIGGCHGSTGPTSINPATSQPWGADFPALRVRDFVSAQHRLLAHFGLPSWAAVVGGSLGGMQAMRWSLEHPSQVRHAVVIASAMKLTAQNIAFNETARQAIYSDPDFCEGHYLTRGVQPLKGLSVARMIGHITYLSDDGMGQKFGRELRNGTFARGVDEPVEFQIESYLRYQGQKFSRTFDANTYILMTRALDYFDLAREYQDDPVAAFSTTETQFLVMSFTSDWRFAPERSREIKNALLGAGRRVTYAEIESAFGHDAFLVPQQPRYEALFAAYMNGIEI